MDAIAAPETTRAIGRPLFGLLIQIAADDGGGDESLCDIVIGAGQSWPSCGRRIFYGYFFKTRRKDIV